MVRVPEKIAVFFRGREEYMSFSAASYDRSLSVDGSDRFAASVAACKTGRDKGGENGVAGAPPASSGDEARFSGAGLTLAAKGSSRAELEKLQYDSVMRFEGPYGPVSLEEAWVAKDGESTLAAFKIVSTLEDGSELVVYFGAPFAAEDETGEQTDAEEGQAGAGDVAPGDSDPEAEAVITLGQLIAARGLGNVNEEDAMKILDAVRARVEAMIEAAQKNKEEEAALEAVKERNSAAAPEPKAAPEESAANKPSMPIAYTSRGMAVRGSLEFSSSGFSRSL